MTETVNIRRNSLFSFVSSITRVTANFVLFWLIARYYSEEIFGQLSFAQSLSTNFLFLADFGFDILLITEISRNREQKELLFQKYYSLKFLFSIFALVLMWIVAVFIPLSNQARLLIFLFSFFMIFSALTNFLFAYFKGLERMEYEASISFAINLILVVSVLLLIFLKAGIFLIGIFFLASRVIGFVVAVFYVKKLNREISFNIVYSNYLTEKKKILIFGLFLLFNNLFFQIDTLLLGLWKGEYEVGIYQSVFKLILLPLIIPDILTNALLPTLSRLFSSATDQWEKTGFIFHKILSALIIPISILLFVYSEQIIHLLYGGKKYLEAIPVLRILSITLFIRFSFESFSLMLTTSNRMSIRMYAVIIATLLNVTLNYFFINKYGALGASLVSLISNIFVFLIYFYFLRGFFLKWVLNSKQLFYYSFTLIVFFVSWFFREFSIFFMVPVICSLILIYVLKVYFKVEERKIIFSTEFGISLFRK